MRSIALMLVISGAVIAAPLPKREPAVVTTASGLKFVDEKVGVGAVAARGQTVEVHYTLWLKSDQTKVDSSVDRGMPFAFTLGSGQVIKGFDEGTTGMKEGGKRRVMVPAALGYGDKGAGGQIPPGADLVFEVELIKVK